MNTSLNPASENSLFDDDFEEAIDLEAVTAIEQSQKMIKTTHSTSTRKKQDTQTVNNGAEEEYLNIDFEPLEYSLVLERMKKIIFFNYWKVVNLTFLHPLYFWTSFDIGFSLSWGILRNERNYIPW